MARQIRPRDEADPDVLLVQNVSGGALSEGDAVMFTVASEDADHVGGFTVIAATVAGEERFAGLVIGRTLGDAGEDIPDDGVGFILRRGRIEHAATDGDVAEGDDLVVSSTDGVLATAGDAGAGTRVLGVALDADDGAGELTDGVLRPA